MSNFSRSTMSVLWIAFLLGLSQVDAMPIDIPSPYDLPYDYLNYYGPAVSGRLPWPLGTGLTSDPSLDALNQIALGGDVLPRLPIDYLSPYSYPKTVDVAKENFVRGSVYGSTEFGTRDEVTIRPSTLRSPYSRYYPSYPLPNYLRSVYRYPLSTSVDYDLGLRRPLSSGINTALLASLLTGAPDSLYLRK